MNINKTKIIYLLCFIIALSVPTVSHTNITYATLQNAELRSSTYHWEYKIENNKMYKRKINDSTGKIETDWIFVKNM